MSIYEASKAQVPLSLTSFTSITTQNNNQPNLELNDELEALVDTHDLNISLYTIFAILLVLNETTVVQHLVCDVYPAQSQEIHDSLCRQGFNYSRSFILSTAGLCWRAFRPRWPIVKVGPETGDASSWLGLTCGWALLPQRPEITSGVKWPCSQNRFQTTTSWLHVHTVWEIVLSAQYDHTKPANQSFLTSEGADAVSSIKSI